MSLFTGNREQSAKGSTVRSTLAFVAARLGDDAVASVLASLAPETRRAIEAAAATDEIPYHHVVECWREAGSLFPSSEEVPAGGRPGSDAWADEAGAYAIDSLGVQLYGGILRKPTPREFLTQSVSLFRLYYHPGDMEVVEDDAGRAVLRLVGFDPITRIFCNRLTGGLRQAIQLAGGEGSRVRHVRCCIEGDAFCEWELHWQPDAPKGSAGA